MTLQRSWSLDPEGDTGQTSYWASYSDLMAGILLVFALAAVASWVQLKGILEDPSDTLNAWYQYVDAVSDDEGLRGLEAEGVVSIDRRTGSLVISESSLRYARGKVELSDQGRQLLERVVPIYLGIVRDHLRSVRDDLDQEQSIAIGGIEISGHTDSTGDYGSNTYVSRERAGRVLVFLVDSPALLAHRDLLLSYGYAAGYADSRPPQAVETGDGNRQPRAEAGGDDEVARRIELRVRIENEEILQGLRALLNQILGAR